MTQHYLIMAKAPLRGFSKTRLAHDIGEEQALQIYEAFLKDFLSRFKKEIQDLDIDFFVTPSNEETEQYFLNILNEFEIKNSKVTFQAEVPFFERLYNKLTKEEGFIHLTGSDIPDFPFYEVSKLKIEDGTAYIGPDNDGGFYYLGIQAKYANVFKDFDTSDGALNVLDVLKKKCESLNLKVHLLPEWSDVDTFNDLKNLIERSAEKVPFTKRIYQTISPL